MNIEQRSTTWHQARKLRITASEYAAVLGHCPFRSHNQVKKQKKMCKWLQNVALNYGIRHEAEARELYEKMHNVKVIPIGFVKWKHWGGCSPDGLVGEDGLLEIKCPFRKNITEIPYHYWIQVQSQLNIMGRKWCDFFVWYKNKEPFEVRIEKDEKWWEENEPKLEGFWLEWKQEFEKEIQEATRSFSQRGAGSSSTHG